ncbi:MAG: hypothetical protein ABEJ28_10050 [Salinigranum sp.]
MTERDPGVRNGLDAGRVRHPRLVGTVVLGVALLAAGALLSPTAPTTAFRVGFVGALVALFGATGYVAFWVNDRAGRRTR